MQRRINMLTLGVTDLNYMTNWYREKFNWQPVGRTNETVLIRLDGLLLVLIQEKELAKDLCVWNENNGFKNILFTIGLSSKTEVDNMFTELQQKGVTVIRQPEEVDCGIYRGCISDPEDNYWEIAFSPFMEVDNPEDWLYLSGFSYQS